MADSTESKSEEVSTHDGMKAPSESTEASESIKDEMENKETVEDETAQLSHRQAMAIWKEGLAEMIENDPLLMDLHSAVTVEEINAQIALEYGQAMTVNVKRADGEAYPIVVMQNATVHDLKQAIKRHVDLRQVRENGVKYISWRYVWKKNWLMFDGEKLAEDHKTLKDYGIRNKAEVTFARRLRQK